MDRLQCLIAVGRDDRARVDWLCSTVLMLPQASECEGLAIFAADQVRLFLLLTLYGLPFIETSRRNQAATPFERKPKRRLGCHPFGPRVQHCGYDLLVS